jgi:hypothetical protein
MFCDNYRSWPDQPVVKPVPFANLLKDVPIGNVGRFMVRDCFVKIGIEHLTGGVNLLNTDFGQGRSELVKDHGESFLERLDRRGGGRGVRGCQGHFETVHDREEALDQPVAGIADRILALSGGAASIVIKLGTCPEVQVPILVGLGCPAL